MGRPGELLRGQAMAGIMLPMARAGLVTQQHFQIARQPLIIFKTETQRHQV